MSDAISIQGILAPFSIQLVPAYKYVAMPRMFGFDANRPIVNHYAKDPSKAVVGELVYAAMNAHGAVEAGYKRGDSLSDFDWFTSTTATPRG